ncbi:MAG: pyrimidine 5'-nucleotidase [Pseudomonadota bacterium]
MRDTITSWIFDLDNTLYDPRLGLLDQISARMHGFVMRELAMTRREAKVYCEESWRNHGITMRALVRDYGIDPADFLAETHDIDYEHVVPCFDLKAAIANLDGQKIIHTNGARSHAMEVLDRLHLTNEFDAVWAIEDVDYAPKPHAEAHDRVISEHEIDPKSAMMFEDTPHNLEVPKARGMTTALVSAGPRPLDALHIDHVTYDLKGFLNAL